MNKAAWLQLTGFGVDGSVQKCSHCPAVIMGIATILHHKEMVVADVYEAHKDEDGVVFNLFAGKDAEFSAAITLYAQKQKQCVDVQLQVMGDRVHASYPKESVVAQKLLEYVLVNTELHQINNELPGILADVMTSIMIETAAERNLIAERELISFMLDSDCSEGEVENKPAEPKIRQSKIDGMRIHVIRLEDTDNIDEKDVKGLLNALFGKLSSSGNQTKH